ncbi:MAG: hypothetical protein IKB16_01490 [Lentisphaeria bacterium]|nr:hypothetical protein [Lentisphaeria bacterium]
MRAAFLLRKCKFYFYTAGLIPAVFLTVSCQCVEDWFDRNKPEPGDALTRSPQNGVKYYTIDEAAASFCNNLIMKFSMYYNGKPCLVWNTGDAMLNKVAVQLYRDNVVSPYLPDAPEYCVIRTAAFTGKEWHLTATDQKTGQILLSLRLPLKDMQK